MLAALALSSALSMPAMAQDGPPFEPPPPGRSYVALVVGLSSYENLPDSVELDFARSDAALVAKTLREDANFDEVFLLADGEATKPAVLAKLKDEMSQLVGKKDLLLIYFVGHGVGADLDLPVLLTFESTLENGQEDGLELQSFAQDLQTYATAGNTLIVTDAIHKNQLEGIYLYGPSAEAWPRMRKGTMLLSSSQASSPATDGAFGKRFAAAIAGAADSNRDTMVTASELFIHLMGDLTSTGQMPVAAGDYNPGMVVSADITPPPEEPVAVEEPEDTDATPTVIQIVQNVEPETVYPDYAVRAAKFVFEEGAAQSVTCREHETIACAPSCYVRDFMAGPCVISAVIDGITMTGEVVVLEPGKVDCRRKGGDLTCEK